MKILIQWMMASVICLEAPGAFAEIVIRHPSLKETDFSGWLEAEPDATSLSGHLKATRPSAADLKLFTRRFENAQRAFLSKDAEEAIRSFEEVVKLAHVTDWQEAQREGIFYSYFRLAQLKSEPNWQSRQLEAAITFAEDLEPDEKQFPPPLVQEWRKLRFSLIQKSVLLRPAEAFPGFQYVRLNGRVEKIAPDSRIRIVPGTHRISLISDIGGYASSTAPAAQIQFMRLEAKPLVKGTCDAPEIIGLKELDVEEGAVLFPDDCLRKFTPSGWQSKDRSGLSIQSPMTQVMFQHDLLPSEAKLPKESRYRETKKTWVIAGLSAIAIGVAYYAYANNRNRPEERQVVVEPVLSEGVTK